MRILSRINSLEKNIKKVNKKWIILSIPYFKSETEKQNINRLAKKYISKENLHANLFVIIINYSDSK